MIKEHDGIVLCHNMFDGFILHKTIWVATLSNGLIVAKDDGRPGANPEKAWLRLLLYLDKNRNIDIIDLYLRYMDNHVHPCESYADGYFFSEAAGAFLNGPSLNLASVGFVRSNILTSYKYRIPELLHMEGPEYRTTNEVDTRCLWMKKG